MTPARHSPKILKISNGGDSTTSTSTAPHVLPFMPCMLDSKALKHAELLITLSSAAKSTQALQNTKIYILFAELIEAIKSHK